jgi:hypothetical protein
MIRQNTVLRRVSMLSAALMGLFASSKANQASARLAAFPKSEPLMGLPAVGRKGFGFGHAIKRDTSIPLRHRNNKSHTLRHILAFKSFN